jgi:hypothetical protein
LPELDTLSMVDSDKGIRSAAHIAVCVILMRSL